MSGMVSVAKGKAEFAALIARAEAGEQIIVTTQTVARWRTSRTGASQEADCFRGFGASWPVAVG